MPLQSIPKKTQLSNLQHGSFWQVQTTNVKKEQYPKRKPCYPPNDYMTPRGVKKQIVPKLEPCSPSPVIQKRKPESFLPDLRPTGPPKKKKRFRNAAELGLYLN